MLFNNIVITGQVERAGYAAPIKGLLGIIHVGLM